VLGVVLEDLHHVRVEGVRPADGELNDGNNQLTSVLGFRELLA